MNLDDYIEGTHDERNPCNQKELEIEPTEVEILEEQILHYERVIREKQLLINFRMSQLRELKEIDESGYDDQKKKKDIYRTF